MTKKSYSRQPVTNEKLFIPKQLPLTKKRFEALLTKAATPISEWQHGQKAKEILVARPSGDYSGKRKRQGKTGDKKD